MRNWYCGAFSVELRARVNNGLRSDRTTAGFTRVLVRRDTVAGSRPVLGLLAGADADPGLFPDADRRLPGPGFRLNHDSAHRHWNMLRCLIRAPMAGLGSRYFC